MIFIRARKSWMAKAPRNTVVNQRPQDIHTIVVHHTAGHAPKTRRAAAAEMRWMQGFHKNTRGWNDIGYNIVIDPLGGIWEGRGVMAVGAHTEGHNTGTIGISFMGNYEKRRLNLRQKIAFRNTLKRLKARGVKVTNIKGHNEMPKQATACPGTIMKDLRA